MREGIMPEAAILSNFGLMASLPSALWDGIDRSMSATSFCEIDGISNSLLFSPIIGRESNKVAF